MIIHLPLIQICETLSLNQNRILLLLCSLFIFGLTYFASVNVASSDSALTLLVSQAIVEHHTAKLDAYKKDVALRSHFDYN